MRQENSEAALMMKVLMVGVDEKTKGGMWTVVQNYMSDESFFGNVRYVATATAGSKLQRAACFLSAAFKITAALLSGRYDIVHIHVSERGSVYRKGIVAALAKLFGRKVILHMHGAEFEPWYEGLSEKKKRLVRLLLDSADRILILGKYWEPFVSSLVKDAEKIRILYNAVRTPEVRRYRSDAEEILFLGEVGQRKGVYDLMEAIRQIDEALPKGMRVMLYGPNPENDIQTRIRALGLENRVFYKGWLKAEKKEAVFSKTVLNVLPSYNEGLPMTILETMAYGIPNIATNIAAIPEAVSERNGILTEPGNAGMLADKILKSISDRARLEKMSQCAYQDVKRRFSLESHIKELTEIYEEMLGRRRG